METFAQSYPAFAALLVVMTTLGQDFAVQGETFVQKLEGAVDIVSPVVAFLPQASLLSAEVAAIKASPTLIEQAAEALIDDCDFSSAKAKAVIAAAFPLAESAVALVPQVEALKAALAT